MAKQIFFNLDARNKMKKGVDTLADAVKAVVVAERRTDHVDKEAVRVAERLARKRIGCVPDGFLLGIAAELV